MRALLAFGALLVTETALAEPIVLECDLPGAGTPGVEIGWGAAWHGFIEIDDNWSTDDYSFRRDYPTYRMTISRNSGAIVQEKSGHSRTGSCRVASKENRRF
jgi:hypothetical protein